VDDRQELAGKRFIVIPAEQRESRDRRAEAKLDQ
jgi:hypothetical protein